MMEQAVAKPEAWEIEENIIVCYKGERPVWKHFEALIRMADRQSWCEP